MTSAADVLLLFLLVFPLIFSPGPSNLMCAVAGAKFGVSRSIPLVVGMNIMVLGPALAVGFGVGEALDHFPGVIGYVQYAGAAFILYLAYRILTSGGFDQRDLEGRAPGVVAGVLLQTLNAKGLALLLVIYSQFLNADGQVWIAVVKISVVITVISLLCHFFWLFGGSWLAKTFASPRALRVQNGIYAALLVAVALWLMVT